MKSKNVQKLSLLKTKDEMTPGDRLRNYTLEVLAISFWLYLIAKVFIFDIDVWLLDKFLPRYVWILNFKPIFFLAAVSLAWLWLRTFDTIVWVLYIALYPIVLLGIRLPIFIVKQKSWLLAFAFFNGVVTFLRNLKYSLIFLTCFLGAFAISVFAHHSALLPAAAAALVVLVLIAYARSFIMALRPTAIYQMYSRVFQRARTGGHFSRAPDPELKAVPVERMGHVQLEKWNTSLQSSVLLNRLCLFAAKRLRDYQRAEWRIIPSILGLLRLAAFTVLSFSAVYYALYKWNPALYSFVNIPTYFTFIYFSFNSFVFNSTQDLAPSAPMAQIAYMIQASLSFVIGVILAAVVLSFRAQKSSTELNDAIAAIESEADTIEQFIQVEYKVPNVSKAMEHLKEAQARFVNVIYWLTKEI